MNMIGISERARREEERNGKRITKMQVEQEEKEER
jgi:hypothetical protein